MKPARLLEVLERLTHPPLPLTGRITCKPRDLKQLDAALVKRLNERPSYIDDGVLTFDYLGRTWKVYPIEAPAPTPGRFWIEFSARTSRSSVLTGRCR